VSVANDLKEDAERDLRDIGAEEIPVYPFPSYPIKWPITLTAGNGNNITEIVWYLYFFKNEIS